SPTFYSPSLHDALPIYQGGLVGLPRKTSRGVAVAAVLLLSAAGMPGIAHASATATTRYTVMAADGVSRADAAAAIARLGGTVLRSEEHTSELQSRVDLV